jgi:hypothetical protein
MAAKKGRSGAASLINGVGFLLAALLVMHIVFVLFRFPAQTGLAQSVGQAATPLALFFPGLIDAHNPILQVFLDFGLAAAFWIAVAGLLAKIFG